MNNQPKTSMTTWMGFGLALLAHGLYLTTLFWEVRIDVSYLKRDMGASAADRAKLHEDIKTLGELQYRLSECEKRLQEIYGRVDNHIMTDKD
jgi:hypothetical protein